MSTIKLIPDDDTTDAMRSTGNALDVVVERDLPPTIVQPSLGDPVNAPGPAADEDDIER